MHKHEIFIQAIKSGRRTTLTYIEKPVGGRQRRLTGRISLLPHIDLGAFSARSVIDWLDVTFMTARDTQAKWVFERIEKQIHQQCKTWAPELVGREFTVRFQEPRLSVVQKAVAAIRDDMGIVGDVYIAGLEVSLDFTPKKPGSDDDRARLLTVLVRHFMPGRDVLSERADRPRFAWGRGKDKSAAIFPLPAGPRVLDPRKFNDNDKQPFADATVYYGQRGSACSWRLMDKVIDRQNIDAGTEEALSDDEKRVRIEVTLKDDELAKLSIRKLDDLLRFKFTRLAPFFRFLVPTFVETSTLPVGPMSSVREARQKERLMKFLATGVVGLKAMDDAWAARRAVQRKDMRAMFRRKGKALKTKRVGSGPMQTLVAYKELNDRVEMAFRKLTERVRKQSR